MAATPRAHVVCGPGPLGCGQQSWSLPEEDAEEFDFAFFDRLVREGWKVDDECLSTSKCPACVKRLSGIGAGGDAHV